MYSAVGSCASCDRDGSRWFGGSALPSGLDGHVIGEIGIDYRLFRWERGRVWQSVVERGRVVVMSNSLVW